MTIQELNGEAQTIQSYLEITVSSDASELSERIATLNVYMARTGQMLAEARRVLRRKMSGEIAGMIRQIAAEGHLSAKAQNALVDSIAEDEHALVDWIERLNAACTNQARNCVSLLSYEKENMTLTKMGY